MGALPTSVRGCARCGNDHDDLVYRAFRQPVPDADGDFTHWAACPETGDPILMRFNDVEALRAKWGTRLAVSVQRYDGAEWQPFSGGDVSAFLREPHEAATADAVFAYVDGRTQ